VTGRATAAVLSAVLTVAACSVGDRTETPDGQRGGEALLRRPCGDLLKPAAADATPPSDVPVAGVTWYDRKTQGKTAYHFGHLPGDQVAAARDAVIAGLESAGYTASGTDEEGNAEADGQFTGPHEGTVQVTPYCKGQLQLRLKLES
jgi:hypothetical protein